MLSYLVVFAGIASLIFTVRGLTTHSWVSLWLSAGCSLVVSFLGVYSIGGIVFLFTCLQLAGAILVSEQVLVTSRPLFLFLSVFVWFVLVPFQMLGYSWLGRYSAYVWVGALGILLVPVVCLWQPRSRSA